MFSRLFGWRGSNDWGRWTGPQAALVTLLLVLSTAVVYLTGGTALAYAHMIYVPILVGAFFFGFLGSVAVGLIGGLCLGPWMPLDVAAGIPQTTMNWVSRTGILMLAGGLVGALTASLAHQIETVRRHAHFDSLTGLPNRARMLEDFDALIAGGRGTAKPIALLAIGLSHFDTVLTTLGDRHTDLLLQSAARCLRSQLPDDQKLYDLGGGNFAVLLPGQDYAAATELTQRLHEALNRPLLIDGVPVLVGGRYGVARFPSDGTGSLPVLRAAAAALREAVRLGLPYAIYDHGSDKERRDVARLLPDLRVALLTDGQLALHYQPKVALKTGECTGVEALVRWQHPERGAVPPSEFIHLAEQTALIGPLTEWVIDVALRQLVDWQRDGIALSIAVNVSVRNLEDADFPALIAERLRISGVEPSRLQIEITESALMAWPKTVIRGLTAIRRLGVLVALDDFGTGHSSLIYLRDLPADTVKLDQSFLQGVSTDPKTQLLVGATIETAHRLGFDVVGEGIEDSDSYSALLRLSCDLGQGYHICRPVPEPALRSWLSARSRETGGSAFPDVGVAGRWTGRP